MRGLFVHAIARCRNFYDISRFSTSGMWVPEVVFIIAPSILARFSLWMLWIFKGMTSIRRTHVIYVKRECFGFSKMQDAFMGASPVIAKVGFVFIAQASERTNRTMQSPQSLPRLALFL